MKSLISPLLRAALAALLALVAGNATAQPAPPAASLPWKLVFAYRATPPNPGGSVPETILAMTVEPDGQAFLKSEVTEFQDQKAGMAQWQGKLTDAELARLRAAIDKANIPAMPAKLATGRSGIEDGWRGSLALKGPALDKEVEFGSFGQPDEAGKALAAAVATLIEFIEKKTAAPPAR
jgi:hypothetical protein